MIGRPCSASGIPESWIQAVLGSNNPFGVFLAVLVGVPMYADIFGTIPVAGPGPEWSQVDF